MPRTETIVVGGGQAGLSVSRELAARGVEHLVLERGRVGESWRRRWQSFCLVTPNWTVQLPGLPYDGPDPDGFMPRDEIVAHLERYVQAASLPIRDGVDVEQVETAPDGGFVVRTSEGPFQADQLVLATGAYQRAFRPAGAATLPASITQIDIAGYDRPEDLPPGRVLIVGSGQSGCQLAEELHEAGRDVVLSCGRAPWAPRRVGGRDLVWWLAESGFLDAPVSSLPSPAARLDANVLATGHHGGRDLHLRTLRALGITLTGRFRGVRDGRLCFASDLAESMKWSDERYGKVMGLIRTVAAERGIPVPDLADPPPFDPAAPEVIDVSGFGVVIFAGGFRPDYGWLPWPEAVDDMGFPKHEDGASTVVPGLHFVGVHFLRKRKSSLLFGVGEDATLVADAVTSRRGSRR